MRKDQLRAVACAKEPEVRCSSLLTKHDATVLNTPPGSVPGSLRTRPPYTHETGAIWQIGVLTAEWSILGGQEKVIVRCFALHFQWKVRSIFVRKVVLRGIFCVFSAQKLGFLGLIRCPIILPLKNVKMRTVSMPEWAWRDCMEGHSFKSWTNMRSKVFWHFQMLWACDIPSNLFTIRSSTTTPEHCKMKSKRLSAVLVNEPFPQALSFPFPENHLWLQSGTEKVPQRTFATKISPNFRANFLVLFASKPLF